MSKYNIRNTEEVRDQEGRKHTKTTSIEPLDEPSADFSTVFQYLMSDEGRALSDQERAKIVEKLGKLAKSRY